MDIKTLVGHKVTHKAFGDGIIVDIDNVYVSVDFSGNIKKFQVEALGQFFRYNDEETRELIQRVLDEIEAAKAAADAAKRAAEEAAEKARQEEADRLAREEAERLAQEKREKK